MDLRTLIKQKLPSHLWDFALKFIIPEDVLEEDPEIIQLILESRAIETEEEKQEWFDLLLLMTDEQKEKLREILRKEMKKLEEIERKYREKRIALKQKYLNKWQQMASVTKINEIKKKEEEIAKKEQEEADNLLKLI